MDVAEKLSAIIAAGRILATWLTTSIKCVISTFFVCAKKKNRENPEVLFLHSFQKKSNQLVCLDFLSRLPRLASISADKHNNPSPISSISDEDADIDKLRDQALESQRLQSTPRGELINQRQAQRLSFFYRF